MSSTHQDWLTYCESEYAALLPLLERHQLALAADQPHLKGERFLQQNATTKSGQKLILLGTYQEQVTVVIKATRDSGGKAELYRERICRDFLKEINFAAEVFQTPPEITFIEEEDFVVSVQQFIEQPLPFLDRPIAEQFVFALNAFKAQEGAHATTASHQKRIAGIYEIRSGQDYLVKAKQFVLALKDLSPKENKLHETSEQALTKLVANERTIEQYSDFLTHTDFVPHNFRIDETSTMYLLDYSSLTFGNKHEGWARFINFMTLYNPSLAEALEQYVKDNRSPEEQQSLYLMRIYRLLEITWYYADKIAKSEDNLQKLNQTRVHFWSDILAHVLENQPIPEKLITTYQTTRDTLRSDEEKERQHGLH